MRHSRFYTFQPPDPPYVLERPDPLHGLICLAVARWDLKYSDNNGAVSAALLLNGSTPSTNYYIGFSDGLVSNACIYHILLFSSMLMYKYVSESSYHIALHKPNIHFKVELDSFLFFVPFLSFCIVWPL